MVSKEIIEKYGRRMIENQKRRPGMTRDEKRIHHREYMREWRKGPEAKKYHCEYMKKWRAENKEKIKEYNKKSDKRRREKRNKFMREWRQAHPFITRIRRILSHAIRDGKLIKPEKCSRCGSSGKIDGHHPDYNKPLEVIWLCQECHRNLHLEER